MKHYFLLFSLLTFVISTRKLKHSLNQLKQSYDWETDPHWLSLDAPTPTTKIEHVDIADDGTVVATSIREEIFIKDGVSDGNWIQMPGSLIQIATSGAGRIVGASSNGTVWQWAKDQWVQLPGNAKSVSIGIEGTILKVDYIDRVHLWNGKQWNEIEGGLCS